MLNEVIKVGDLRKSVNEKANELNAKLGTNVETENKKNNEKSYKETEKNVKNYDGGLSSTKSKKEIDRSDDKNRGMLDYNPSVEPDEKYKKRIEAQAQGYTSTLEKNNKTERNAEFDDDKIIYNSMKKNASKHDEEKANLEHSGLVSSQLPKQEKNSMYENINLSPKRLIFKKTTFVNESQMLSRIPEEYKIDGQKIYMKDCKGNEYIVECNLCKHTGNIETTVLNYNNEQILNEKVNRMRELFEYDSAKANGSIKNQKRIDENTKFNELLNHARKLSKK